MIDNELIQGYSVSVGTDAYTRHNRKALTMTKSTFLVCDIAELTRPDNSLYKEAKKHGARDFALVGGGVSWPTGTPVEYCVLITETVDEAHAQQILTEYWQQAANSFRVFAWIPLNDIKEMTVMNLEKHTQQRTEMLYEMLGATGAFKYIKHHTARADLEALVAQLG